MKQNTEIQVMPPMALFHFLKENGYRHELAVACVLMWHCPSTDDFERRITRRYLARHAGSL